MNVLAIGSHPDDIELGCGGTLARHVAYVARGRYPQTALDGPMRDLMHGFMAIKRHATGEEIAGLTAYLAGPEAGIITGAMHTIDGGFGA